MHITINTVFFFQKYPPNRANPELFQLRTRIIEVITFFHLRNDRKRAPDAE